jgi:uncharacterized membrane protein YfhO
MTDDRSYWFKAKSYGIGWTRPVTWQGWATVLTYLALIVFGLEALSASSQRVVYLIAITALLVAVVFWKGEKPVRWRWGGR